MKIFRGGELMLGVDFYGDNLPWRRNFFWGEVNFSRKILQGGGGGFDRISLQNRC